MRTANGFCLRLDQAIKALENFECDREEWQQMLAKLNDVNRELFIAKTKQNNEEWKKVHGK